MALAHLVHRNLLEKKQDDKEPIPEPEELVQVRCLKVSMPLIANTCLFQGAVEQSQDSLFCQIVAASFYLDAKEYATVKNITEGALQLLSRIQKEANVDLSKCAASDTLNMMLQAHLNFTGPTGWSPLGWLPRLFTRTRQYITVAL